MTLKYFTPIFPTLPALVPSSPLSPCRHHCHCWCCPRHRNLDFTLHKNLFYNSETQILRGTGKLKIISPHC